MENKWIKYLTYFNAISMITLLCLISFVCVYTVFDYIPSYKIERDDLFKLVEIVFQFVLSLGVLLAYIEYKIKHNWEQRKGLELSFNIQKKQDENLILFKTSVSNKANKPIIIDSAFLLITLHEDNFLDVVNKSFTKCFKYVDELEELINLEQRNKENCIVIPLDYYYSENIQVGNETLRYVSPLQLSFFEEADKIWDVRFFVFIEKGYHRSVHSAFKGTIKEISNKI